MPRLPIRAEVLGQIKYKQFKLFDKLLNKIAFLFIDGYKN